MSKPWKNNSLNNENIYQFLRDETKRWVTCQYCGRTLQFCQLMAHWRTFHDSDNSLILDFIAES